MKSRKKSKATNIMPDNKKSVFPCLLQKKEKENQEIHDCMIQDNVKHMLIVSGILVCISIIRVLGSPQKHWMSELGVEILFLVIASDFLWYFISIGLIQNNKAKKVIYISFWIVVHITALKESYTELLVNESMVSYYILMYLVAGFYIATIVEMILFIGLNTTIMIVMINSILQGDKNNKNNLIMVISVVFICAIIMLVRYCHYIMEKEAQFKIRERGAIDGLTNLLNRRGFEEKLSPLWKEWSEQKKRLVAIMVDIDYFKSYNDTYGHIAGDQCLKDISECIYNMAARRTEFIVRYGGEEIVVVLTKQTQEECIEVAFDIQQKINSLHMKAGRQSSYPHVTVSMGIASMTVNEQNTIYDLIEKADEQLYHSKNNGRNKITMNHTSVEAGEVSAASLERKENPT